MLGKVVAGAALGGASLLLFSPGAAYAAGHAYTGNVVAKPQVSLLEFCPGDHGDWDHKDFDRKDWDRKDEDRKDQDRKDQDRKDQDRKDQDRNDHCMPRGHVDGGDGGMATTSLDRGMAASGVSVIGAAALGGMFLLRRRRANELG